MPQVPATAKQLSFIAKLAGERQLNADEQSVIAAIMLPESGLTKFAASKTIGTLLAKPPVKIDATGLVTPPAEVVEPGYYVKEGEYYEVVLSKAGRAYAKQLTAHTSPVTGEVTRWSWEYAKGAVARLTKDHALTEAQAAEFGWIHHHCMRCCAELTVQESIDRGYGPVCAAKMGIA